VSACVEMSSSLAATEELVKKLQHENKRTYLLTRLCLMRSTMGAPPPGGRGGGVRRVRSSLSMSLAHNDGEATPPGLVSCGVDK